MIWFKLEEIDKSIPQMFQDIKTLVLTWLDLILIWMSLLQSIKLNTWIMLQLGNILLHHPMGREFQLTVGWWMPEMQTLIKDLAPKIVKWIHSEELILKLGKL